MTIEKLNSFIMLVFSGLSVCISCLISIPFIFLTDINTQLYNMFDQLWNQVENFNNSIDDEEDGYDIN